MTSMSSNVSLSLSLSKGTLVIYPADCTLWAQGDVQTPLKLLNRGPVSQSIQIDIMK